MKQLLKTPCNILLVIPANKVTTQRELIKLAKKDRGTISKTLMQFKKYDLIKIDKKQEPHEISLTKKGKRAQCQIYHINKLLK